MAVTTAMAIMTLAAVSAAAAGATAYSAKAESTAAKKAASAQEAVGMAQIKAAQDKEILAADTAKSQLKLKQASKTNTILTAPGGMVSTDADTNQKSILGV